MAAFSTISIVNDNYHTMNDDDDDDDVLSDYIDNDGVTTPNERTNAMNTYKLMNDDDDICGYDDDDEQISKTILFTKDEDAEMDQDTREYDTPKHKKTESKNVYSYMRSPTCEDTADDIGEFDNAVLQFANWSDDEN